jgi:uncharacterized membrane protein
MLSARKWISNPADVHPDASSVKTLKIFSGTPLIIEAQMKKLGKKGLRWLKGFHLIAVSCWVGGAVALLLLYFLKMDVIEGGVLFGINQSIHHVDMSVVVIPGALGCLLTGLIYSSFSNWGFFKHNWLIFLGPWETRMMEISGDLGMSALADRDYLYNQKMNFIFGVLQCLAVMVTVFISIFKPWKKKKSRPA